MKLLLNGEEVTYDGASNLAALLESRGHTTGTVAVALNEEFVPRSTYSEVELKDGDDIEVVSPMQGG
ncbi:thiamine biosynthesis protein ThiS [bacterium M21]|nr:thiamine biosynthesis protein ThiS [bacterium M21]